MARTPLTETEIRNLIGCYNAASASLTAMITGKFRPQVHARCLRDQAEIAATLTDAGRADIAQALWLLAMYHAKWETARLVANGDEQYRTASALINDLSKVTR